MCRSNDRDFPHSVLLLLLLQRPVRWGAHLSITGAASSAALSELEVDDDDSDDDDDSSGGKASSATSSIVDSTRAAAFLASCISFLCSSLCTCFATSLPQSFRPWFLQPVHDKNRHCASFRAVKVVLSPGVNGWGLVSHLLASLSYLLRRHPWFFFGMGSVSTFTCWQIYLQGLSE